MVRGRGVRSHGRLRSAPVAVEVQATDRLDLGLELLDVEALDTGQYRALVIVDPADKRKLKGFVHLSAVALPSALQGAKEMDPEEVGIRAADQGGLIMPDWRHAADVQGPGRAGPGAGSADRGDGRSGR